MEGEGERVEMIRTAKRDTVAELVEAAREALRVLRHSPRGCDFCVVEGMDEATADRLEDALLTYERLGGP